MIRPTLTITPRSAVAIVAVTVAACGGSETKGNGTASGEPQPARADRAAGPCPVTTPNGEVPAAGKGFNYGNGSLAVALWPNGKLVAGPLLDGSTYAEIKPDGSIVAKLAWWRAVEGQLKIEGERLDAAAPPLRADIPGGYGSAGLQATLLTFPTQGCWKVVGGIGRARLTFVVLAAER